MSSDPLSNVQFEPRKNVWFVFFNLNDVIVMGFIFPLLWHVNDIILNDFYKPISVKT